MTCVDEVPPSLTDYISTDALTANTKNTFTFAALPVTPELDCIGECVRKGRVRRGRR